jgi:hypothetical protein
MHTHRDRQTQTQYTDMYPYTHTDMERHGHGHTHWLHTTYHSLARIILSSPDLVRVFLAAEPADSHTRLGERWQEKDDKPVLIQQPEATK